MSGVRTGEYASITFTPALLLPFMIGVASDPLTIMACTRFDTKVVEQF